ncbi:MAG: GNAT family N-acetyltransferase [Phycisphaerae bacterium]
MHEWTEGEYCISTDRARLDLDVIHAGLDRSYWASGIPRDVIVRSIAGSLCFGLYHAQRQIGFARVISDGATFAYLSDVFVREEYRGRGIGQWFIRTIVAHPQLQGLRRWLLATRDAHGLYRKFGFRELECPEIYMEMVRPDAYRAPPDSHPPR